MSPPTRRLAPVLAIAVLLPLACSGDDGGADPAPTVSTSLAGSPTTAAPQPLTGPQAELFASMRLANYRAVAASFDTHVEDQGSPVDLHGVVDWQRHVGSAVYRVAGRTDDDSNGLMQWNFAKVAAHPGGAVDGAPPPPPADGAWIPRDLDPTRSTLDTVFLLLLNLGAAEPENPQLLRQSDAAYIGAEIVHGQTASVFRGPSSDAAADPTVTTAAPARSSGLTYWVAPDGLLLRMQAVLGQQTVVVDFGPAPTPATEYLPDLVAPA